MEPPIQKMISGALLVLTAAVVVVSKGKLPFASNAERPVMPNTVTTDPFDEARF